jgi:hypothetical protein
MLIELGSKWLNKYLKKDPNFNPKRILINLAFEFVVT